MPRPDASPVPDLPATLAALPDFAPRLIAWHARHGRTHLPWQQSRDPYRIWLSEIMLQQTQVDTVIPYYQRFLARCPDVAALAAADSETVMGLWAGLGYYSRARNLHRAAQVVCGRFGGQFPHSAAQLAELPGIGRSTAAAIAAFAWGERAAILDGNVRRVVCRAFGIAGAAGERPLEKTLWALVEALLPETDLPTYTQAQMDLGATVCTRSRPQCVRCPLADACVALREGRVAQLPTPRRRKPVPRSLLRLGVVLCGEAVWLTQRPSSGVWGGLLGLPELPGEAAVAAGCFDEAVAADWLAGTLGLRLDALEPLEGFRHALTHRLLDIEPWLLRGRPGPAGDSLCAPAPGQWRRLDALDGAPVPAPVRQVLQAVRALRPGCAGPGT